MARLSGVSSQTVSRVVNNYPYVSEDTRRRVLDAIQQLDYRPNRAARSLATRRSCMLGIVSFGISYYGPAQMMANIEQAAKLRGYSLAFSAINRVALDEMREAIDNLSDLSVEDWC